MHCHIEEEQAVGLLLSFGRFSHVLENSIRVEVAFVASIPLESSIKSKVIP